MRNENANRITSRRKRRGFTLTEIAIVLGIVGLILGAIWVAAAAVYNNLRISHSNTQVLQIVQGVRGLYAAQPTIGTGDQTTNLINAGVIPKDLINGAGLTDAWGGTMFVGGSTDGLAIVITMNGLNDSGCIGLVSAIAGNTHDTALTSSSNVVTPGPISSTPAAAQGTPLLTSVAPVALGTIAAGTGTGCTTGATNAVQFYFGLKG